MWFGGGRHRTECVETFGTWDLDGTAVDWVGSFVEAASKSVSAHL